MKNSLSNLKLTINQYRLLQVFKTIGGFSSYDLIFKFIYLHQCESEIFKYVFFKSSPSNCDSNKLRSDIDFLLSLGLITESRGAISLNYSIFSGENLELIHTNKDFESLKEIQKLKIKNFEMKFCFFTKINTLSIMDNLYKIRVTNIANSFINEFRFF